MTETLFEVEGRPVRLGDELHVHPGYFARAGAKVMAEFRAYSDSVTVRSENGAVPTLPIDALSWQPFPETVVKAEIEAAGFKCINARDVALWIAAKALATPAPAQPEGQEAVPVAWRVSVAGSWEMFSTWDEAQRERAEYEKECADDPDAVHQEPEPLYDHPSRSAGAAAPAQPGPLHVANERGEGEARGIEKAARWVDRRRDEYEDEHGTVDPETGSMEFGRGPSGQAKQDYVETLWEIAEGIRALSAAPKEKP